MSFRREVIELGRGGFYSFYPPPTESGSPRKSAGWSHSCALKTRRTSPGKPSPLPGGWAVGCEPANATASHASHSVCPQTMISRLLIPLIDLVSCFFSPMMWKVSEYRQMRLDPWREVIVYDRFEREVGVMVVPYLQSIRRIKTNWW